MNGLVDSHCHLDNEQYAGDFSAMLDRAGEAGVERMLSIGTGDGPPELDRAVQLAARFPQIYASVGVHPHDAGKIDDATYRVLRELLREEKVVVLGEIGLDYHYDHAPRDTQRGVFVEQLAIARDAEKPVAIHTREAWSDTMAILREHWPGGRGILHCFTGTTEEAREALELGFHLAFGGVATFPKAESVRDSIRVTPLDRILVETDAPYLAPVPHRGKRNEPSYAAHVARKMAEVKGISVEELIAATTVNFERLCLPGRKLNEYTESSHGIG